MRRNSLDPRTAEELLADAERYERWAERTCWNTEVSANFRRLAVETRAKVAARGG